MQERLNGFLEAATGALAALLPWVGRAIEDVATGAHVVASIGGAAIAVHGVWRIFRPRWGSQS